MAGQSKTNVMRVLQQQKIPYTAFEYPHKDGVAVDGVTVAAMLNQPPQAVFKTLVARADSKNIYVFVIPVAQELDLKKAAKAAGEKAISMVRVDEIQALTGYLRGGCSPVGMKKRFPIFFHETAFQLDLIMVSGGKIGMQVQLSPTALCTLVSGKSADLCTDRNECQR